MKMYNAEISGFQDFIFKLKLKGKKSRMRMRFFELLGDQLKQIQKEQQLLLEEQNAIDENGQVVFIEGTKTPDVDNMAEYEKEFNQLLNEEFYIEENDKNKDMLLVIKEAILDYDEEVEGQDAANHYRMCKLVEEINYGDDDDLEE
jgi:hypothetical protein